MRRTAVRITVVLALAASLFATATSPVQAATKGSLTVLGAAQIGNGIAYPCLDGKTSPPALNPAKCGGFLTSGNTATVTFTGTGVGVIENLNKPKCGSLPFTCFEAGIFTITAIGTVRGACSLAQGTLWGNISPTLSAGTKAKPRSFTVNFLWLGESWFITGATNKGESLAGVWDIKAFLVGSCNNKAAKQVAVTGDLEIVR